MASVHYFTRSNSEKGEKEVTIWARIFIAKKEKQSNRVVFQVSTNIKVPSYAWDKVKECAILEKAKTEIEQRRFGSINTYISEIKTHIHSEILKNEEFTPDICRGVIRTYLEEKQTKKLEVPKDVHKYIKWIIQEMNEGRRLFKGNKYDYDTIKQYGNLEGVLNRFASYYKKQTGKSLVWDSFESKNTADMYMTYLEEYGYMVKTRNKYVSSLKTLLEQAELDQLHKHNGKKHLYKVKETADDTKTKVYLTDTEIQALYDMYLEPGSTEEKVRDIFLCGCYTGQRISDYGRLNESNFTTTSNGVKIVKLKQEKTDTIVVIPIINDNLLKIIEKYEGNLPRVADQVINRYIKDILEVLSDEVKTLARYERTILTMQELRLEQEGKKKYERDEVGSAIKPRYELVSTHTARRSCLTNLYKLHIFSAKQLMSISGHKDEKTFYEYILLSGEEVAEEIAMKLKDIEIKKNMNKVSNENLF
ncbi:MAG: tyrosine-type recombinase/integrase [Bacteroidales bacterium]|nr:tyrosine-type recombinase/integrase [Bacteroidales bacterium]